MEEQAREKRIAAGGLLMRSPALLVWLCVLSWVALATVISLTSNPPGTQILIAVSKWFDSPATARRIMQAILHLILFGVGAILLATAVATIRRGLPSLVVVLIAAALIMAYGCAVEYLQDYIPGRRADLLDLLGDFVGAVLFLGAAWVVGWGPFDRSTPPSAPSE
jgi:VanZ family protein